MAAVRSHSIDIAIEHRAVDELEALVGKHEHISSKAKGGTRLRIDKLPNVAAFDKTVKALRLLRATVEGRRSGGGSRALCGKLLLGADRKDGDSTAAQEGEHDAVVGASVQPTTTGAGTLEHGGPRVYNSRLDESQRTAVAAVPLLLFPRPSPRVRAVSIARRRSRKYAGGEGMAVPFFVLKFTSTFLLE